MSSSNAHEPGGAVTRGGQARAIYVMSPAGAIRDQAELLRGADYLRSLGFEVTLDPAAAGRYQRFSGTDDERLAAFERAMAQPAGIVMATRGGYGLSRLLHRLDWAAWARSGKRFVGYSDCTAFSLGLLASTGAGSDAGPMVCGDFGALTPDPSMVASFLATMDETPLLADFAPVWPASAGLADGVAGRAASGQAEGTLWGGNLALLASLIGTPYLPQVQDGILFLEDVGESPFRVERMLSQLLHAGILGRQRAVLLGRFTDSGAPERQQGHDLKQVFDWLAGHMQVPLIGGLPHGHVPDILTLPIGARVCLQWQAGRARLSRR
ncbi:MAG: Murein tetrapeptide carboxypeptidase [Kerstersia gyiorum]|uniref:LD-carboxypeptidase n=1 Tax=Kerstersia gyiorum TaxID=206506 RepID=UPI0030D38DC6